MGLRFRKRISILPGVNLNLGKSSASVSVGVPGFRKTFNTKGTVTTSVGLPGTGLYYVDTKNPRKEKEKAKKQAEKEAKKTSRKAAAPKSEAPVQEIPAPEAPVQQKTGGRQPFVPQIQRRSIVGAPSSAPQFDRDSLLSIHKTADDSIDWNEVAASPEAPDASYNQDMWAYYHSVAADILAGDIDTFLKVIYEVNPLDDLMEYGSEFTFGTDDAALMEVEFIVNTATLQGARASMRIAEYNELLQDFISSIAIRISRDIFALLPVQRCIVHAMLQDETVLSVCFDRAAMEKIRFGFIDPSDTIARFRHNMNTGPSGSLGPVDRIE